MSVVIPTFNRHELLPTTVASVLAQTHRQLEVIVVDDCSDPPASECLTGLLASDARLRVIRQPTNAGASAARNVGIAAAQGEFVALVDDDDTWQPQKISQQIDKLLSQPDAGFCYAFADLIQPSGEAFPQWRTAHQGNVLAALLRENFVNSATPVVRRSVFEKVGRFDESFASCQDWEMWVRIAERFPFVCVPEPLAMANQHHGGERVGTSPRALHGYEQFLEKFRPLLSHYPKTLAAHLEYLGFEKFKQGDGPAAHQLLSAAAQADPWSLRRQVKRALAAMKAIA